MTMISPVPTRIEDILNAPTAYSIPAYQRDFKWGEAEARDLVEDLDSYRGNDGDNLFLGNFIFEAGRDQKTFVIDGQQRLTSIMLLLVACRMRARALGLGSLVSVIQTKLTFVDSATAQAQGCRFVASESIRDAFEYIAGDSWNGDFPRKIGRKQVRRQVNRLRPIYSFFLSYVSHLSPSDLSGFLRAIYNAYVIRITINDEEEALSIFERTNARGLELEVADLLKNYLFSRKVEGIEDRWREIVGNAEGTILRMLKYFYVSRFGHIQKQQLYRKLREYGNERGPKLLTEELVAFSRFYALTKAPTAIATREYFQSVDFDTIAADEARYTAIADALQALSEFGITQFVPVAFSAIELARRSTGNTPSVRAKALLRLFDILEKYHFVNNVVCERVGNEVEKLYSETCAHWAGESELLPAIERLGNELRMKSAGLEEFKGRFADISYAPDTISIICYIFDRLNNYGVEPAQRLRIFQPSARQLRRSNNIEHWLPQSLPENLNVDEETRDSVDSIGNLLPLYFKTNSRLGNLPPAEKATKLTGPLRLEIQNLPFVQGFLTKYGAQAASWNAKAIRDRSNDLAVEALQTIWKF